MTEYKAICLVATVQRGIEIFEIEDDPDASFERSIFDFTAELAFLQENEKAYYQVLPEGTDGEYEILNDTYGIRRDIK